MGKSRKRKRTKLDESELASQWEKCFSQRFTFWYDDEDESTETKDIHQIILEVLAAEKVQLNNVKSQLNCFDIVKWRKHTTKMHKCGFVVAQLKKKIKAELVTQAWAKFFTILNTFDFFSMGCEGTVTTVHLCEAPGAFVASLNHFLELKGRNFQWDWIATTLNPYYEGNHVGEMIPDDRFIIKTLDNWEFGFDYTGNIMRKKNLEQLKQKLTTSTVFLVTADGSIDCSEDPGNQETIVSLLFLWEVVTALNILSFNGSFVLKIFTVFEHFTISLLYFLTCVFRNVTLFKPGPSKPGNSEVYVVSQGFLREKCMESPLWKQFEDGALKMNAELAVINLEMMSPVFLTSIKNYVAKSCSAQKLTITDNIESYCRLSHNDFSKLQQVKNYIAKRFLEDFSIRPINKYVSPKFMSGAEYNIIDRQLLRFKTGSFDDRHKHQVFYDSKTGNDSFWEIESVENMKSSIQVSESSIWYDHEEKPDWEMINMFKFIVGEKCQGINCSFFYNTTTMLQFQKIKTSSREITLEKTVVYEELFKEIIDIYSDIDILNVDEIFVFGSARTNLVAYFKKKDKTVHENKSLDCGNMEESLSYCELNIISLSKSANINNIISMIKTGSPNGIIIFNELFISYFWYGVLFLLFHLYEKASFFTTTGDVQSLYVILVGFHREKLHIDQVVSHLNRVVDSLCGIEDGNKDVLHIMPIDLLLQSRFCNYAVKRIDSLLQ